MEYIISFLNEKTLVIDQDTFNAITIRIKNNTGKFLLISKEDNPTKLINIDTISYIKEYNRREIK